MYNSQMQQNAIVSNGHFNVAHGRELKPKGWLSFLTPHQQLLCDANPEPAVH